MLIVRSENLNNCFTTAFRALLEIDIPQMTQGNMAEQKCYIDFYRRFKKEAQIPAELADRYQATPYARIFTVPRNWLKSEKNG